MSFGQTYFFTASESNLWALFSLKSQESGYAPINYRLGASRNLQSTSVGLWKSLFQPAVFLILLPSSTTISSIANHKRALHTLPPQMPSRSSLMFQPAAPLESTFQFLHFKKCSSFMRNFTLSPPPIPALFMNDSNGEASFERSRAFRCASGKKPAREVLKTSTSASTMIPSSSQDKASFPRSVSKTAPSSSAISSNKMFNSTMQPDAKISSPQTMSVEQPEPVGLRTQEKKSIVSRNQARSERHCAGRGPTSHIKYRTGY